MFKRRPKIQIEPTDKEYEKLGREVEQMVVKDYINFLGSTRKQIWGPFVRGVFAGLGGVIGATVMLGLLVALLKHFEGLPLISHYVKDFVHQIQQGKP